MYILHLTTSDHFFTFVRFQVLIYRYPEDSVTGRMVQLLFAIMRRACATGRPWMENEFVCGNESRQRLFGNF